MSAVSQVSTETGTSRSGAGAAQAVQPPALSDPTSAGANSETSGLAVQLRSTRMAGVSAGRLPDRDYLITEGTHIPCVLQTALDSTQPGLTACIVPNDILSDNGRVVLLDKGTKIVGEYSGDLHQGEARIFVVWTRAETPTGVVVDLSSPATDALGRSGFDGHVNNHFWQRFGGAILLSVIDDSLSAAGNYAASAAGGTNYANNTQAATESSASTALQNTINIKPTLRKNQGEEVAVTVARDLDFSSVYSLAPAQ